MPVTETSREALNEHRATGKLGAQSLTVKMAVRVLGGATRTEIADHAGIGINAVSGRVRELLDAGDLVVDGRKRCSVTGRNVECVRLRQYTIPEVCEKVKDTENRVAARHWAKEWLAKRASTEQVQAKVVEYGERFRDMLRAEIDSLREKL